MTIQCDSCSGNIAKLCECDEKNAVNEVLRDLLEKLNDIAVIDNGRKVLDRQDVASEICSRLRS